MARAKDYTYFPFYDTHLRDGYGPVLNRSFVIEIPADFATMQRVFKKLQQRFNDFTDSDSFEWVRTKKSQHKLRSMFRIKKVIKFPVISRKNSENEIILQHSKKNTIMGNTRFTIVESKKNYLQVDMRIRYRNVFSFFLFEKIGLSRELHKAWIQILRYFYFECTGKETPAHKIFIDQKMMNIERDKGHLF
ncbi:MAG: hypothetical protein CME62_06145 [Halobacteriovoraceae bacterium]|nr:hypothetical protein [Halobacteriovoraceae bacterium]|tara:strand:- start:19799 stop:20371 length:573 start_codon:yes stop_codon:yes gene_type:complete